MRKLAWSLGVVSALAGLVVLTRALSQPGPVFVDKIHLEYRDGKLISVAREEDRQDDIRAILGNDIALAAYRAGTLPFADGAMIARLAWGLDAKEEDSKVLGDTTLVSTCFPCHQPVQSRDLVFTRYAP